MRKMISFLAAMLAVALVSWASVSAAELYPRADGNDVLVPDFSGLIQTIPKEDGDSEEIYAATDLNGWFVRGSKFTSAKVRAATTMTLEGEGENAVWRAKGLKGKRFHPVRLDKNGKPKWALIESVYDTGSEFVDTSGSGPCLLVK